MRLVGRFLMAAGLVLLPIGLYAGMVRDEGMTVELTLLGVGALLFLLGRGLAGPAREG
jgi:hypothetical protein